MRSSPAPTSGATKPATFPSSAWSEWLVLPLLRALMDAPLLLLVVVILYNWLTGAAASVTPLAIMALVAYMVLGFWWGRCYTWLLLHVKPRLLAAVIGILTILLIIYFSSPLLLPIIALFAYQDEPAQVFAPVVLLFIASTVRSFSSALFSYQPGRRYEGLVLAWRVGLVGYAVLLVVGIFQTTLFIPTLAMAGSFLVSGGVAIFLARHLVTGRIMPPQTPAATEGFRRWYWRYLLIGLPLALLAFGLALATFLGGATLAGSGTTSNYQGSGFSSGSPNLPGGARVPSRSLPPPPPPSSTPDIPWLTLLIILSIALLLGIGIFLFRLWRRNRRAARPSKPLGPKRGLLGRRLGSSGDQDWAEEAGATVRAAYRQLLRTGVVAGEPFARLPAETPTEYGARLAPLLRAADEAAPDVAVATLEDLTTAYVQERYRGAPTEPSHRGRIRDALPQLLARIKPQRPGAAGQ